jgi:hypothetical protein
VGVGGDLQAEELSVVVGVEPGRHERVDSDHPVALADLEHESAGGNERVGAGVQRSVLTSATCTSRPWPLTHLRL